MDLNRGKAKSLEYATRRQLYTMILKKLYRMDLVLKNLRLYMLLVSSLLIATMLLLTACYVPPSNGDGNTRPDNGRPVLDIQYGKAAYYSRQFIGRPTASGELYDPEKLTAGHMTLPFGSICRVINLVNGKQVEVRINDRGPYVRGRIIDVSERAARQLQMIDAGVVEVKLEVLKLGPRSAS